MSPLKADQTCLPVQQMVFQKMMPGAAVNDFSPRNPPGERLRPDGVLYVNDICYGTRYPNSHVDLWFGDGVRSACRPTLFYIHGGGFIFGDKVVGDPLAVAAERDVDFSAALAKLGYNVVTMNYALAPEYRFPVQVHQVDEMLSYLTVHQADLELDMEHVFLGGGSAGADLAEIYGAALCNPDYARRLGFTPSIQPEQIKGLIIDEAALSTRHFVDAMDAMLGCWIGSDDLKNPDIEAILNPVPWIQDRYFPAFINSSNQEIWFLDSAQDLAGKLKSVGADYEFFYRGPEHGALNHGYLQKFASESCAKECFQHLLAFLQRQLEK